MLPMIHLHPITPSAFQTTSFLENNLPHQQFITFISLWYYHWLAHHHWVCQSIDILHPSLMGSWNLKVHLNTSPSFWSELAASDLLWVIGTTSLSTGPHSPYPYLLCITTPMCIPMWIHSLWALPTPIRTLTLTPINSLSQPQSSPLTSIHNIVAAWKEHMPTSTAKNNYNWSTPGSATSTSSSDRGEGLFSLRRRVEREIEIERFSEWRRKE